MPEGPCNVRKMPRACGRGVMIWCRKSSNDSKSTACGCSLSIAGHENNTGTGRIPLVHDRRAHHGLFLNIPLLVVVTAMMQP